MRLRCGVLVLGLLVAGCEKPLCDLHQKMQWAQKSRESELEKDISKQVREKIALDDMLGKIPSAPCPQCDKLIARALARR